MRPILSILALACAGAVRAQDPLLTLKEMLSGQKPFSWVQTPTNPENSGQSTPVTASITGVSVDSCTLSLKDGRVFPKGPYESVQTWQFKMADIDQMKVETLVAYVDRTRAEGGHPGWATKTTPSVFTLQITASPNRKFAVHRWSKNNADDPIERDLELPSAFVVFPDERTAQEVEKAMQNAKAFCAPKAQR